MFIAKHFGSIYRADRGMCYLDMIAPLVQKLYDILQLF
jgi:Mg-chelatase subunit ChlI